VDALDNDEGVPSLELTGVLGGRAGGNVGALEKAVGTPELESIEELLWIPASMAALAACKIGVSLSNIM